MARKPRQRLLETCNRERLWFALKVDFGRRSRDLEQRARACRHRHVASEVGVLELLAATVSLGTRRRGRPACLPVLGGPRARSSAQPAGWSGDKPVATPRGSQAPGWSSSSLLSSASLK